MAGDYAITEPVGERAAEDVDFGAVIGLTADDGWGVQITVTSNGRQDVYSYSGWPSQAAANAAVASVIMAVAKELGIETDAPPRRK